MFSFGKISFAVIQRDIPPIPESKKPTGEELIKKTIPKNKDSFLKIKDNNANLIFEHDRAEKGVFSYNSKHAIFVSKIDDQVYTQSPLLERIRHSFTEFIEKERQLNK